MRYSKEHASRKIEPYLLLHRNNIKNGIITPFANCTRSEAMQIDLSI